MQPIERKLTDTYTNIQSYFKILLMISMLNMSDSIAPSGEPTSAPTTPKNNQPFSRTSAYNANSFRYFFAPLFCSFILCVLGALIKQVFDNKCPGKTHSEGEGSQRTTPASELTPEPALASASASASASELTPAASELTPAAASELTPASAAAELTPAASELTPAAAAPASAAASASASASALTVNAAVVLLGERVTESTTSAGIPIATKIEPATFATEP